MRITAGVCVLAAGLLFGAGGAVASAEPDSGGGASSGSAGPSGGSSANDGGADASGAAAGSTGATAGSAGRADSAASPRAKTDMRITLRVPRLTRLSPTGVSPSRQGGFKRPMTIVRGGVDTDAKKDADTEDPMPIAAETETALAGESETATAAESGTAVESGVEAQGPDTAPGTEGPATEIEPGTEAPVQTVPADASAAASNSTSTPADVSPTTTPGATKAVLPIDGPVTPVSTTADPLTNAFVTINGAMVTWSESLAALPTSNMPVRDAIESLQTMLTTVVEAVTHVPGDFYAMLGIPASAGPPQSLIGGSGTVGTAKVSPPADGPLVGPHGGEAPHIGAPAGGASLFGTMAPRPVLGKVAIAVQPLSVSGTVPLTTATTPASAKSIFEHVIEAVLVPASLTALAAVALPGVGALLVVAAAGVRVGYRQAKAGLALRASGVARFAGPGPLGIARSASMVALRQRARGPRTKRAVCPEAARAARTLERIS